ncbi:MAG TPA: hypothetical protein VGG97_03980 [Bryobacteraceae bacterium]|jgi:hypothetical protein
MKQALHIFKKDVRYLRYDIGITLLAIVGFCFIHNPLIPLVTWWFLISRVIHAEALPGDRQFWLTRPYEWKSLLGAKILFIFIFVNLPLLVADAVIIRRAGFSIGQEWAGLLWTQVLLITAFVLPAAAFSAITKGLGELLTMTLFLVIGFLTWVVTSPLMIHPGFYWMELEWVKTYCLVGQLAAAAAIVLLWQYARRNTFATRMTAGATAVVVLASSSLLPWTAAFALQTHLSKQKMDASSLRIELDSGRKWLGHIYAAGQDQMVAELPLQFSGVPAGTELKPNGATMTLRAPDGETWIVKQPPPSSLNFESGVTSLRAVMGKAFYTKVKNQPLQLRGTLYFTLYGNKRGTPLPLNSRPLPVNGVGICSADTHFLLCYSAFRTRSDLVAIETLEDSPSGPKEKTESLAGLASYSPFPAELNVDPVSRFFLPRTRTISGARVEALQPLAHLERSFEIEHVRLDDFVTLQ